MSLYSNITPVSLWLMLSVFSPSKIQGTTVGHTLGGGCGHIKAFGISLFTHQRKFCTEGLLGRHALRMLGRTLAMIILCLYLQQNFLIYSSAIHYHYNHAYLKLREKYDPRWEIDDKPVDFLQGGGCPHPPPQWAPYTIKTSRTPCKKNNNKGYLTSVQYTIQPKILTGQKFHPFQLPLQKLYTTLKNSTLLIIRHTLPKWLKIVSNNSAKVFMCICYIWE